MTATDRLWMPLPRAATAPWATPDECREGLATLVHPPRTMAPRTAGLCAAAMRRTIAGHLRAIRADGAADWREEVAVWLEVAREAKRVARAHGITTPRPEAPFAFPDLAE